jgi:hypothetical protein
VAQPAILARQADRAPEIWLYKHQDRISAWRFRRQGDGNAMPVELMILSWLSQGKQKP